MTVTLASMKAHLNITTDLDDALIQDKLDAASEWVAGFTGGPVTEATAAPIHEAIRQIAAHLYENRESTLVGVTAQEMPMGALMLLDAYRDWP